MTDNNTPEATEPSGFVLGDALYAKLKWFVQIVIPAFATFYATVGNVLGFGHTEPVLTVSAALATFLGVILGLSSRTYNNSSMKYSGMIEVLPPETPDGKKTYSITVDGDVENIDAKGEVTFKVFKR